jgi:hypothetical protein
LLAVDQAMTRKDGAKFFTAKYWKCPLYILDVQTEKVVTFNILNTPIKCNKFCVFAMLNGFNELCDY